MKRLTRNDVKKALFGHSQFRDLFPELKDEIIKAMGNPSCPCNVPLFDQILMKYKDRLKEYFGDVEIKSPQEEAAETSQNHWKVINCKAEELEEILNKLHKIGRVQLAVARYEDEVTLIVNEIGYII